MVRAGRYERRRLRKGRVAGRSGRYGKEEGAAVRGGGSADARASASGMAESARSCREGRWGTRAGWREGAPEDGRGPRRERATRVRRGAREREHLRTGGCRGHSGRGRAEMGSRGRQVTYVLRSLLCSGAVGWMDEVRERARTRWERDAESNEVGVEVEGACEERSGRGGEGHEGVK